MTKYIILIALTIVTLETNAQYNSKTEADIRKLEDAVRSAILNADSNTLQELWAPEFLVNNPRNEITESRDSVLLLQKAGMINYSTFEKTIERVQLQKNIVITMGFEIFVPRNDLPGAKAGQAYKRRFTNIWMKKKGKWQQIARHASILCQ